MNYLGSKVGRNQVPLEYIGRKDDEPEVEEERDETYNTEHERLVKTTPLTGTAYEFDNGQVWSIVKQLTLNGPAWAYISQYEDSRDGRAAIKSLIAHYEGPTQISKEKLQAYEELRTAEYWGEKRHSTFEHYVHRHTKALKMLQEYGEIISKQKKVSDFLNGIKTTDQNMLAGKAAVHSDARYNQNFTECTSFLLNFIQAQPKSSARNISSTDSARKPKGKGKAGGRNPSGRAGTAKHSGNYSKEQWAQLSVEQKAEISRKRNEAKDAKRNQKRVASAVKTKKSGDDSDDASSSTAQDPGNQFAAANKKKPKK